MRWWLCLLGLAVVNGFAPPGSHLQRTTALEACRRNSKKEKRKRNAQYARKFSRATSAPQVVRVGGKRKTLSRKKLNLKASAEKEKARENAFMARLFTKTGFDSSENKYDLGLF